MSAGAVEVATSTGADGVHNVRVSGALDRTTVPAVHRALRGLVSPKRGAAPVRVDLGGVERGDTAGVALFQTLLGTARARGVDLAVTRFSLTAEEAFRHAPAPGPPRDDRRRAGLLEWVAKDAAERWGQLVAFMSLTADTVFLNFGGARRTARVRRGATGLESVRVGVDALPIVSLIAFLIGTVVALQAAYQLARFGASVFVADLIAVSMTREMGPLMTAIIIAGRSGASIAAEIATMKVSEEVDALRAMGLQPIRYIVVPKFRGLTLTMPLLVAYANLLGMVGGYAVALLYLDIGSAAYWDGVTDALVLKDILTGLVKSLAFAWIIVLVAAHKGFQARGGAESVGLVTTASVVSSIFWVIVADAVFSLLFYFGG